MKKRLIKLLAFVLVLTFALAPIAVNAETRVGSAQTVSLGSRNNDTLFPTDMNQNTMPLLGIVPTLPYDELIRAYKTVFNVTTVCIPYRRHYITEYDDGIVTVYDFGHCTFKNFTGTATLKYYVPFRWNPLYADDMPYYELIFKGDMRDGNDDSFFDAMANYIFRDDRLTWQSGCYYYEGPYGDIYQISLFCNELTYIFARPENRSTGTGMVPIARFN